MNCTMYVKMYYQDAFYSVFCSYTRFKHLLKIILSHIKVTAIIDSILSILYNVKCKLADSGSYSHNLLVILIHYCDSNNVLTISPITAYLQF